jgi:pimeloyl-ACP methyl ester carboxylesterase
MYRIESLLSARLFLAPKLVEKRLYFISNLSGRLSLYAMDYGGSVPEPLLPPEIALQNPHLTGGEAFYVFPKLGKILVMLDRDGDEVYKPMFIPIEGGYPEPAFEQELQDFRAFIGDCDAETCIAYMMAPSLKEPLNITYRVDFENGTLTELARSMYGAGPDGHSADYAKAILVEGYSVGDNVVYLWDEASGERKLVYGKPIDQRAEGEQVPLNAIHSSHFVRGDRGIIFHTTLFDDAGGLAYLNLDNPGEPTPVAIQGVVHAGVGEFNGMRHLTGKRYAASYNIDGCDWVYEGTLDEENLVLRLEYVIVGQGTLSNGVVEHISYEKASDSFALSFSTATSPTQIYTVEAPARDILRRHTNERILGIPGHLLSSGEDASFTSFDGTRVSARLYLPAAELGFEGPRPVVYYVHGGPQSQERPDFAWFSMPLIQFLTLNGFAVFVPNVRGSSGYGLSYMKQVDRDWGGKDRLDHVHAMTAVLPKDPRLDVSRAAVVGRSYGGYMTLTLAARHPELWSAAVDMFGPYSLLTFSDRIPETWKPYFHIALGHPEKDRDFLIERSPNTYMDQLTCPMLVIQGKNDPRVVEPESRDLVEYLRSIGKTVDYLMFENEGHDVLKHENRVTCYNAITDYFKKYLQP